MEDSTLPAGPALVLEVLDADSGEPVLARAARLIHDSGELVLTFERSPDGQLRLPLEALEAAPYQLRVDLEQHPPLPFNLQLGTGEAGPELAFVAPAPRCCTLARAGADTRVSLRVAPRHQEMVLVAGWDYSGGADNTRYATSYRDDRYAGQTCVVKHPREVEADQPTRREVHDHTMVTLFDFGTGVRTRWWKGEGEEPASWHEIDVYLQGSVPTFTGKYNDPESFRRRHADDSISITHVYDYLIRRGATAPGCVVALHFFCHAWDGGPLLVNTDQQHPYGYGQPKAHLRDPGDKDGRSFDFSADNMPRADEFRAAFAAEASIKLWGCLAVSDYRRMARAAMRALAKGRPRDELFKLELPSRTTYISLDGIEAEFRYSILADAYTMRLSEATGLPVYGPPPGAGASLQRVGKRDYMYVNQSTYAKLLAYLEQQLGMPHDETGYVRYMCEPEPGQPDPPAGSLADPDLS